MLNLHISLCVVALTSLLAYYIYFQKFELKVYNDKKAPYKEILFWSENIFGTPGKYFSGRKMFKKCPKKWCVLTFNRTKLETASAIVFHWPNLRINSKMPPRNESQKWVFFSMESPLSNSFYFMNDLKRYQHFSNVFDLTMTYRKNSDVVAMRSNLKIEPSNETDYNLKTYEKIVKNKTKMAAWFVSNHKIVTSNRNIIVKKLQKYGVQVDIYGKKYLDCPRISEIKCREMLKNEYKFYLSFENSNCKDYVTEKFFKTLNLPIVPVTLGGANYKSIIPESGYIDVASQPSIEDLAKLLIQLDKNDTLYMDYFKWKIGKKVTWETSYIENLMCDLCDVVSKKLDLPRKTVNITKWWLKDKCIKDVNQFNREYIDNKYMYL